MLMLFQPVSVFTFYISGIALKHLSRSAFMVPDALQGYFKFHEFPPHLFPPPVDTQYLKFQCAQVMPKWQPKYIMGAQQSCSPAKRLREQRSIYYTPVQTTHSGMSRTCSCVLHYSLSYPTCSCVLHYKHSLSYLKLKGCARFGTGIPHRFSGINWVAETRTVALS